MAKNVGESALQKLKNMSKETGIAMPALLRRYAQERLLYRLSISPESKNFCVKGGVLLSAYYKGRLLRPSDDIDFNGFLTDGSIEKVATIIREVAAIPGIDDGVDLLVDTIRIKVVREDRIPGGKISLIAKIGSARVDLSVDVGFGNKITPAVRTLVMPTMLGSMVPAPTVLAYPIETVCAEKFAIVVENGLSNSRLKDYFDMYYISKMQEIPGQDLVDAVKNTFKFRKTDLPTEEIVGYSPEFIEDNLGAWNAFLRKIDYREKLALEDVVDQIKAFMLPVAEAALNDDDFARDWSPQDGWSPILKAEPGL